MVAYSFNAHQYQPQYGISGGLPAGPNGENVKYKVMITNTSKQDVEKNNQIVGSYLAIELTCLEGPHSGVKHIDRLNLHHTNPQTVEIANKQLSAYCHVLNVYNITDTAQLHNIPFLVEIGKQKSEPKYTEVKSIFDVNGNEPGKAGSGPQAAMPQQQAPMQMPPQQAPQQQAPQPQAGGWGAPASAPQAGIDNNVPMPDQQAPQQQQAPQGWGAPAPQQQQAPGMPPAWGAPR